MKQTADNSKSHYSVTLQDGSTMEACCGPMIVALEGVEGYSVAPGALQCMRSEVAQSDFLDYACPIEREAHKKELEICGEWPHPNSWDKGGTF